MLAQEVNGSAVIIRKMMHKVSMLNIKEKSDVKVKQYFIYSVISMSYQTK